MTAPLPPGLRARVLAEARAARPAGRAVPEPPSITAVEAFSRAADALNGLLSVLADEQWLVVALRDLDVYGLVEHLTGVEDDVRAALGDDPAVAAVDHL